MLRISVELFAWGAAAFQGARSSCARCAGVLVFAAALGTMPSLVLAETEGDYTYDVVDNQTATITKYNGPGGDVVVPNKLGGYPVAQIGSNAFIYCRSLTGVEIPDGVTCIGYSAFMHCVGLTSVGLPDSVTHIRDRAFNGCTKLANVVIPDSVTSIGNAAFAYSALTSVVIPDSVTSIEGWAFSGCNSLASAVIGDGVANLGSGMFDMCFNLTSMVLLKFI